MIRKISNKLGIDRAIGFTILGRLSSSLGGIVSVLIISTFLTSIEQGFYYTFGSILALQIFFELGLTGIITQYVAHERVHLQELDNQLIGENNNKSRLAYLLQFSIKWYGILSILLSIGLLIGGYIFFISFYQSSDVVYWKIPWLLLVIGTSINFIISPISAFIEGLGKVKEIAKIRLVQQIMSQIVLWGALSAGLKLYAVIFAPFLGALIFIIMVWKLCGKLLLNIWRITITKKVSYLKEIFPYQWRIALSWMSGYFIFQLFNPVIFAFDGATTAGQMGMTITIINSIQAMCLSWIMTKVPQMSSLIALKQYKELDTLFNNTIKQLIFIAITLVTLLFGVLSGIKYYHLTIKGVEISNRVLPYLPMLMMAISMIINLYVGSIATYLRCHKKEPFLINSIVGGVLCMFSTIFLGKYYGVYGVTIGYFIITLSLLPWAHRIFIIKKKQWHQY